MNVHVGGTGRVASNEIIKLAILAVGGQGGGVVTSWIVDLAEAGGYLAQSTSVPGVAQRTGATIYYVEMVPKSEREPILSLMPAVGDVDIVLASELMEAGRAIQRGFVTPGRTTLITSTHRAYAVAEKSVPGSGIFDDAPVLEAAHESAKTVFAADLEQLATAHGSVISASLFGALAGAAVLPFPREAFEATIRRGGRGVEPSLAAFAAAFEAIAHVKPEPAEDRGTEASRAANSPVGAPLPASHAPSSAPAASVTAGGSRRAAKRYAALLERVEALPEPARQMALHGLHKVVDFQDPRYGEEYLDRLAPFAAADRSQDASLTVAAAKAIANAMAYDDVIKVADLKTRGSRKTRVHAEVGARDDQLIATTEYMHPRGREVCGLMPAPLGAYVEARPRLFKLLDRRVSRGRRVRTDRLRGFLPLYLLAGLRPLRRALLRHRVERRHLADWLTTARRLLQSDPALAEEVLRCRRLIKGYSDTHDRGLSKFDRVLSALPLLEGRSDGAAWLRRLREAALLDEEGVALAGALRTVASLETPPSPARTHAAGA